MTTTRRSTLAAIGGIGALAAAGPVLGVGDHEDDERDNETNGVNDTNDVNGKESAPTAAVRIAHFSPDAPNVDVYVDDEQVLADVAYDTISPYLEIAPGSYQVRITAAGDSETVVFDKEVPVSRAFYTITAIGELEADTFRALVLTDAGSALIRLAHVSPDAPAVDVVGSEGAPTLFENVAFGETTNYVALPAGMYSLDIRPAAGDGGDEAGGTAPETSESGAADDNETEGLDDETDEAGDDDEAVATVEVTLESETAYTAFATGYLEAEPSFAVRLDIDGPEVADEPVDDDVDDPNEPTDDADDGADDDANDTGFGDDTNDHDDTDDYDDNDTDDDC